MPGVVDLPRITNQWSEVDRNLYNQLPLYMAKRQVEYIKYFDRWGKLLKPQKWVANVGNVMRGVNKVPAPILRSEMLPQPITSVPRKDVIEVRETREDCQLYRHDFDSQLFHFLPSFQDFLTDHVDATNKSMVEQIVVAKDLFYRTAIFHGSPYIYTNAGVSAGSTADLVSAPHWTASTIALSKTADYLRAQCQNITKDGLGFRSLMRLATIMFNDLGIPYYSGGIMPEGSDGKFLNGKYVLLAGSEVWDNLAVNDDFVLQYKDTQRDLITGPFVGSLGNRWTVMLERFEMRLDEDGNRVAPSAVEENPNAYDFGDTVITPAYQAAPWGVAFAIGAEAWKGITVGPPPAKFGGDTSMSMRQFNGMDWNGKVMATRNVMIPSVTAAGDTVMDLNSRGEYLKLIADVAMGVAPIRRKNIIPILYKRTRISA